MKLLIGIALIQMSHLLNSVNKVWYSSFSSVYSPIEFALTSYAISMMFFIVITFRMSGEGSLVRFRNSFPTFLWLNILSAATFFSFLYALKYSSPVVVSSVETGCLVIFVLSIRSGFRFRGELNTLLAAVSIVISTFLIAYFSLDDVAEESSYLGLLLSFFTSIGAALIILTQRKLFDIGFKSTEIMAHRFYIVTAISLFAICFSSGSAGAYIEKLNIEIVFVAFLGVTVCLYLIQKGIEYTSPLLSAALMATMPITTFVISIFTPSFKWDFYLFTSLLLLTSSVAYFVWLNIQATNQKATVAKKVFSCST